MKVRCGRNRMTIRVRVPNINQICVRTFNTIVKQKVRNTRDIRFQRFTARGARLVCQSFVGNVTETMDNTDFLDDYLLNDLRIFVQ